MWQLHKSIISIKTAISVAPILKLDRFNYFFIYASTLAKTHIHIKNLEQLNVLHEERAKERSSLSLNVFIKETFCFNLFLSWSVCSHAGSVLASWKTYFPGFLFSLLLYFRFLFFLNKVFNYLSLQENITGNWKHIKS